MSILRDQMVSKIAEDRCHGCIAAMRALRTPTRELRYAEMTVVRAK